MPPSIQKQLEDHETIRRIADYQRISGIIWIILGILQICCIFTIIAGIWNVVIGIGRLKSTPGILMRNRNIPLLFEGIGGYIALFIVNLIFGAFGAGICVIAFLLDLYVRDQILANRNLFNVGDLPPSYVEGAWPSQNVDNFASKEASFNDLEKIESLANLRDKGILTEAEFQQKKTEILSL
ncbi:SHOCT domain-containing protein [Acetobacteraceae bacterium]|nr:SHOCT domain-containing protein [Acetobacteraceae bacterium]